MSFLGNLSTIGGGIMDVVNFGLGMEQRDYDRKMQQTIFNREDTAVQRRVKDLEAAGLNPVLAAGSAAQTGAPIRTSAPQYSMSNLTKGLETMSLEQQLLSQKAQIAKTEADTKYIQQQTEKSKAETDFMSTSNPLKLNKMELDNMFANQTLNERIETIKTQLTGLKLENANKTLDNELSTLKIAQWKIENVGRVLDNRLKETQLSSLQKDCLIKDTVLRINDLAIAGKLKDLDWYDSAKLLQIIQASGSLIGPLFGGK